MKNINAETTGMIVAVQFKLITTEESGASLSITCSFHFTFIWFCRGGGCLVYRPRYMLRLREMLFHNDYNSEEIGTSLSSCKKWQGCFKIWRDAFSSGEVCDGLVFRFIHYVRMGTLTRLLFRIWLTQCCWILWKGSTSFLFTCKHFTSTS